MKCNKWIKVEGYSNMGEDYEYLVAKLDGTTLSVAYMAFGGVKIVELSNVTDVLEINLASIAEVVAEFLDDWEIAIPIESNGNKITVIVDSISEVTTYGGEECPVTVLSAEEYDSDTLDELDADLLKAFDLYQ